LARVSRRSLRVGFDATSLDARGKGVARYVRELLPELARLDAGVELVVLAPSGAELPPGCEALERVDVLARPAVRWEQVGLPAAARSAGLSLVHTTSDRLPLAPRPPVVLYLFEDPLPRLRLLRGERTPKAAAVEALTRLLFPLSLRRAALVLASSHATAADVARRGVPAGRVRVVYPGVGEAFRPAGEPAADGGYVLHFSSDDPRDNSDVALDAYARASRVEAAVPRLVVAGPVERRLPSQRARAARLGIADRVSWIGYQSGDALVDVYRRASVYVDPSLFEGFGFQVAEALASGVPVVCSNVTSLPELTGGAAILAAPHDVAGFADALVRLAREPATARALAEAGAERARRFRWSRTAEETVEAWLSL
jgi:alpha-1,3-rhamnosyl/mannosyltransferase